VPSTSNATAPESFVENVLAIALDIPPGRVMTYGSIAAVLGSRAARVVGQVMARYGSDVPWWRVIRASGEPPLCHEGQALQHYLTEKTPLRQTDAGYRIDLRAAAWWPDRAD
jgi:alkylated DNA nucleotide flippase Atl1